MSEEGQRTSGQPLGPFSEGRDTSGCRVDLDVATAKSVGLKFRNDERTENKGLYDRKREFRFEQ